MELRGTPRNSVELQFIINYLIIFRIIFTFYDYFNVFSMHFSTIYWQYFIQINSMKLHGTPWNSKELQGTPRNSEVLQGTPMSSEVLRGSQNFNLFLNNVLIN